MSGGYRRSPRAISSNPGQFNNYAPGGAPRHPYQGQQPTQYQPQPPSVQTPAPPPVVKLEPPPALPPLPDDETSQSSAITKALEAMEEGEDGEKKKWKRSNVRIPKSIRKKKMNRMLSRVILPKTAAVLLHEFKPGVIFKFAPASQSATTPIVAEVEFEGRIIGTGTGPSKSLAKSVAAESAIKTLISGMLQEANLGQEQPLAPGDDMEVDEGAEPNSAYSNLPWVGLASFAMYRLFSEWQQQGMDVPLHPGDKPKPKPTKPAGGAAGGPPAPKKKIELPPNAKELHPCVLLNHMHPGLCMQELSRTAAPNHSVTVGYEIDGKLYTGTASNRKQARKDAAKAACSAIYNIVYTDEL